MDREIVEGLRMGVVLVLTSALLTIGIIVFLLARNYGGEFYNTQAEAQRRIDVSGLSGLSYTQGNQDMPIASLYAIVSREWKHVAGVYVMGKDCQWKLVTSRADGIKTMSCGCKVGIVTLGCTCNKELSGLKCTCIPDSMKVDTPIQPKCGNFIARGVAGRFELKSGSLVSDGSAGNSGWTLVNADGNSLVTLSSRMGQSITYLTGPEQVLYARESAMYDSTLRGRAYVSVYQDSVTLGYNIFVRRLP